ncbi:site-specific integrase [Paludibacteraceae bacterium OttesenSCG-928-F17]|nr:site-specific integrase [Paludibacteraceae bacterium OttesenSCG-928-F17]
MSATVSVVCYRNKKLSNGESPLMIRISKDRKTKYKSLGLSLHPDYWDFKKNRPKLNCPNRDYILKIIIDKEAEYQKQILELMSDNKEFTASTLIAPKSKIKQKTVAEFYTDLIQELSNSNKIGNARIYETSFKSLKAYTGNKLDIPFSHIDLDFLKGYEKWLRLRNCSDTTLNLYFRTLRSTYNKAIEDKHAKKVAYPFDDFKISKFSTKTEKRAISKENIKQIMNMDLSKEDEYTQLSRDLFIFSYLCSGINFTDMANLKSSNIMEGRLIYIRQKTNKKINIPLSNEAIAIIQIYNEQSFNSGYIFPILNKNIHITDLQKYNRRKKVLLKVNRSLKKISEKIGANVNLTTYVARHSYATVLKNSGVNIALIGETLGHSDLKTTQIYLDSFENEQIDRAMENLL